MLTLGIESTCDETGVALVRDGKIIEVNRLSSSVDLQKKFGGVIPEVAAREQVKVIIPLISDALSGISLNAIDAIAVSFGPGLVGSLLVGVETAKALAYTLGKPLIAVNHLEGHIYANWLESNPKFPLIGLIVSGGHTDLILMRRQGDFKLLGSTLDDACGEAFDKVAKFLELGYPGGPEIEVEAQKYKVPNRNDEAESLLNPMFPSPMIGSSNFNFSFSGLKTAVVNYVSKNNIQLEAKNVSRIAYYFQDSVVRVLVNKTLKAAKKYRVESIVVGGGVAANTRLRDELLKKVDRDYKVYFPEKKFSVDNGAMIAAAAFYKNIPVDPLKLFADPNLHF
ncbi:MAG: tRNA (adenosine(37)-N6)-threonylcarbamoyltransferase complex transferase subunit TsaD [Patescibacteria group bacterium]